MFHVRDVTRPMGVFLSTAFSFSLAGAELIDPPAPSQPKIAAASNEGELAMKTFQLQPAFRAELFAAEPLLANPVAFHIDHQNRFFISETFRLHAGVTDIRGKMSWLDEDLASRSADDRLAMMKRHEGTNIVSYELFSDRVKLVLDENNDGKADRATVFADGFNHALDGIASGVLSRDGRVYFANLPNLWLLKDVDGDGVADERRSLSYGYGVRVGFLGHDLHGLIMGPDGRLYFSIGDRGSSIEVDGKRIGDPDAGSVFRCNPDGTELEVFATGLRNPQELAFDEFGNLFTGDNNSDGGDRARLVYLVQGGDSGWRIGFQFIERPNARGPWNSERMWHPQWEGQPAYIIPPIANMTDGPSGFAYYPGVGLPAKYDRHFFLVDFHGGRSSGIHSFRLEPRGTFFELANAERFLWDALPTDVAFGPEPGLYFTDWVEGWGMTGKGRIYRVFEPDAAGERRAMETRELLRAGFENRSLRELERLLGHVDMRIRQEAQFELATRGERGVDRLARTAVRGENRLARMHGIWGMGQLLRRHEATTDIYGVLATLVRDEDPEIRAQAAKVIGDSGAEPLLREIVSLITDAEGRVRVHAAIAAGELRDHRAVPALLEMLRIAENRDPVQRHAAAFALARIGDIDALLNAARDPSTGVRMGVLLALRRLERAEIAVFLKDSEPFITAEAVRAINDVPISGAIPELAALSGEISNSEKRPEVLRRIVNANYRYGTAESASRLASMASAGELPPAIRSEAISALASWNSPSGRDAITGLWRPVTGARDERHAREALTPVLAQLLSDGSPGDVGAAAARAAADLRIDAAESDLHKLALSSGDPAARVAALRALARLDSEKLAEIVQAVQDDSSEDVRKEALRLQSELRPAGALDRIEQTLRAGTLSEKQNALGTLGNVSDSAADMILNAWMDRLLAGDVPPELQLDVIDAAAKREDPALKTKIEAFQAKASEAGELGRFAVTLYGGNKEEGRRIFFERPEASCVRCHKIEGENSEGGEVGPELTGIASKRSREYLLESVLYPNKQIAEGFESVLVTTRDGTVFAGTVKSEDAKTIHLLSPEDGDVTLEKDQITSRQRGLSSMPEGMDKLLSNQDIRNLMEYLSTLK